MSPVSLIMMMTWKSVLRDRVLHALFGVAVMLLLFVPTFSLFSMRQVQELAITLSLSALSLVLFVVTTLLGASSLWRDIERRYTTSMLGMPVSRGQYVLGKFLGISLFILVCSFVLGVTSFAVIKIAATQYKADLPIVWGTIATSILFDSMKYILVAAVAVLFSAISTSFFLPYFGTIATYLVGNATQEVFEYIKGEYGTTIAPATRILVNSIYYVFPNFSAFNLKVQAIYALPLDARGLMYTGLYFMVYTSLVLLAAIWIFERRDLP